MAERLEIAQFKMSEYDRGWNDYLSGAEGPEGGPETKEWWKGFTEAAAEYPRDDQ